MHAAPFSKLATWSATARMNKPAMRVAALIPFAFDHPADVDHGGMRGAGRHRRRVRDGTTHIVLEPQGFEQIGIRRGYYQAPDGREDAIVLKLELRQATN